MLAVAGSLANPSRMSNQAEMPANAPSPSVPPSKSKRQLKRLLLGLVGLLVVLGGGAAIYYYVALGAAVATRLPVLARHMPKDLQVFAEVPNVRAALRASQRPVVFDREAKSGGGDGDEKKAVTDLVEALAGSFGLSRSEAEAVLKSVDAVAIGARGLDQKQQVAVVVGFRETAAAKTMLASKRFKEEGELAAGAKRYSLASGSTTKSEQFSPRGIFDEANSSGVTMMWHESAKLLAIGDEKLLSDIAAVASGTNPSLEQNEAYKKAKGQFEAEAIAVAFFDPASLVSMFAKGSPEIAEGYLSDPGPYTLSLALVEAGMRITAKFGAAGHKLPDIDIKAPTELTLPDKLTRKTLGYMAFSTRLDMKGAAAIELFQRELKKVDPRAARRIERRLLKKVKKELGVSLAEIIDAIGDEGVISISTPETIDLLSAMRGKTSDLFAVTFAQRVEDKAVVSSLMKTVSAIVAKELARTHSMRPEANGFVLEPVRKGLPLVEVRLIDELLIVAGGNAALTTDSIKVLSKGGSSLADEAAHELAMDSLPKKTRMKMWFDLGRLLAQSMKMMPLAPAEMKPIADVLESIRASGDKRITSALAMGIEASKQRFKVRLDSLNMIGTGAALGIYGVRRYLSSAKTSEAKNTIGAISRGATAAYERERIGADGQTGTHALCKSAIPVPATVPRGRKYQPNTSPGKDFETGDSETGWKCLKFGLTQPHYYQYTYNQGSGYKGTARGNPTSPGPNGYESAAEGDLDGDGNTALFIRTGTVDPKTGRLKSATQIYIVDEHE